MRWIEKNAYDFDERLQYCIYNSTGKTGFTPWNKKLLGEYYFRTYDEWKGYIEEKYEHVTLKTLYDLLRFFSRMAEGKRFLDSGISNIIVPFIVLLISLVASSTIPDDMDYFNKLVFVSIYIVIMILAIIGYVSCICGNERTKYLMYRDLEKIIQEMISEKLNIKNKIDFTFLDSAELLMRLGAGGELLVVVANQKEMIEK